MNGEMNFDLNSKKKSDSARIELLSRCEGMPLYLSSRGFPAHFGFEATSLSYTAKTLKPSLI